MNQSSNPTSEILDFAPIKPNHAELLFLLAQDPEVTQYLTWDATTKEDMAKFYKLEAENFKKEINYSFCVFISKDNVPIGSGSLIEVSKTQRCAAIGYWIGKEYWGNGYGTELVRGLVDYGFDQLALHRIYCSVRTENTTSIRILEKNGFRKEGVSKQSFWRHGQFRDLYQYAILKNE